MGEYNVPGESGSVYDVFDSEGRHLRTVDAVNGNHLLTFTDDDDNRLIDVTDLDGDSTRDIWIHALSGKFEDLII